MARFSNPFSQYLSDSGRILPGAKLFFYVNGTTTPQATYEDAAFTVVNPNPVICDSAGRVPDIYMPGNLVYSITLKDTNDVQISQADDITGSDSRVSSSDVIAALAANTDPVVINGSDIDLNANTTIDGTLDVTGTISGAAITATTTGGDFRTLLYRRDNASPGAGNLFHGALKNDADEWVNYSTMSTSISSPTDGSEVGFLDIFTISAGVELTQAVRFQEGKIFPANDVVMPNGNGIDFSAAGGDVLDQYDNWSFFSPVIADALSGGNTGTGSLNGRWAQIGDIVHVNILCENINTAGMTGGNTLIIRNLPVTVNSDTIASYGTAITQSVTLTEDYWVSYAVPNNAALFVRGNRTGTTLQNMTVADLNSGAADLFLSIRYRAA